ncbi:TetR/AcrR family transcriptional regulator [Halomonas sp. 707D4]|uniref:TetR/AcrR family transcriptional regulator n=1 Tax=Halomonas sp. 707D4 TaxID=1904455 RepID=UPI0020A16BCE|nr:TetR/AcrR family transcriptional regulator [Halomonas sp. 707D4]MCP1326360.1 TetR/AcrR family transcriptional regulator [Halomonas sp. 707D4]
MTHSAKTPLASPRKRTRLPPDVRRQYLLDAALDEFARLGFEGARVEAIALAAGLSKAGFYAHFDSKEALFEALLETIMLPVDAEQAWPASPGDSLEAAVDGFLGMLYGDGSSTRRLSIMRLLIIESGRDPQRIRQWYEQRYRPYIDKRQRALECYLRRYTDHAGLTSGQIALAFSPAVQAMFWQMILGGEHAASEIAAIKESHRDIMLRLLSTD